MIYFDMKQGKVVMDRTESGLTDFGKQAVPHDIELAWDKQRVLQKARSLPASPIPSTTRTISRWQPGLH